MYMHTYKCVYTPIGMHIYIYAYVSLEKKQICVPKPLHILFCVFIEG